MKRSLVRLFRREDGRVSWSSVVTVGVPALLVILAIPVLLGAIGGTAGLDYGYGGGPPPDADLALANMPINLTVNATSPSGAIVSYVAPTAVDEDSVAPLVQCDHASGSVFAIGSTLVTCSVSDADDANSPVSAAFNVSVQGALPQLTDLREFVSSLGAGTSLSDQVQAAMNDYIAGDVSDTCGDLSALINAVQAQTGKKLTSAQASDVLVAAQRIRSVVGC